MENRPSEGRHGVGYETRDVNVRGLVIFGVGLFVTLVITFWLLAGLFHYFAASQSLGPPASPFAETRVLPPQPRLQVSPRQDLTELRRTNDRLLNSYGWVDQKNGIAHIPIDRAMDALIQQGLPVRQPATAHRKLQK